MTATAEDAPTTKTKAAKTRRVPAARRETAADIEITADPRAAINVSLVGQWYQMKRPKTALLMKLAISAQHAERDPETMYEVMSEVLNKAFGTGTATQIQERLEDSEDDLEYEHITELMQRLMSYGTGNPSTSS